MQKPKPRAAKGALKGRFGQMALVLQGGGALGAYQAGAFEALSESGCEPDWLSGISIGAINSAIIAGNKPAERLPKLRQFWETVTASLPWPMPGLGDDMRRLFNVTSAAFTMAAGQPGFFRPIVPINLMQLHGVTSVYDTGPLKTTLENLIDFDRINARETRLSLGAVDIRRGNFVYFDNTERTITVDHVMASGALPLGFPPIEIDGENYWDGGIVSNTPLVKVLDSDIHQDTLVFQVDLFSARGPVPDDLLDVEARRKHITYSSRTRLNTDTFKQKHELRRAIVDLFERLPSELRRSKEVQKLRALGDSHAVAIVHLIYRRKNYEGQGIDYEFSRASMREHWQSGLDDARRTLSQPRWLDDWDDGDGVRVFDLTREPGD